MRRTALEPHAQSVPAQPWDDSESRPVTTIALRYTAYRFEARVQTNGRIKQSLAYWCLNATSWKWNIDQICEAAVQLGCSGVELVPPELWPVVRTHGLEMPLAHNGMPDPVFVRGLNNPRFQPEVIART